MGWEAGTLGWQRSLFSLQVCGTLGQVVAHLVIQTPEGCVPGDRKWKLGSWDPGSGVAQYLFCLILLISAAEEPTQVQEEVEEDQGIVQSSAHHAAPPQMPVILPSDHCNKRWSWGPRAQRLQVH